VAAYTSLNLSALLAAFQLGIQPLIARSADGKPLYAPFPLEVTIPAMALEHVLLFGFVEAAVTVLVIKYFQKNEPEMLG
jgi:cobalt/nickel transport system permease protein